MAQMGVCRQTDHCEPTPKVTKACQCDASPRVQSSVQMVKEVVLDERPPAGKVAAAVDGSRIVTSGGLFSAPRKKIRLVHLPGEHVSDYPRGSAFCHGAAVGHAVPRLQLRRPSGSASTLSQSAVLIPPKPK
jgi:hypothetical protein